MIAVYVMIRSKSTFQWLVGGVHPLQLITGLYYIQLVWTKYPIWLNYSNKLVSADYADICNNWKHGNIA